MLLSLQCRQNRWVFQVYSTKKVGINLRSEGVVSGGRVEQVPGISRCLAFCDKQATLGA